MADVFVDGVLIIDPPYEDLTCNIKFDVWGTGDPSILKAARVLENQFGGVFEVWVDPTGLPPESVLAFAGPSKYFAQATQKRFPGLRMLDTKLVGFKAFFQHPEDGRYWTSPPVIRTGEDDLREEVVTPAAEYELQLEFIGSGVRQGVAQHIRLVSISKNEVIVRVPNDEKGFVFGKNHSHVNTVSEKLGKKIKIV